MARSRPLARWGVAALLCVALLGLIPSTALAVIALVQQKNGSSASATSLPVPFTTAPTTTAGNVLIMVGGTSTGSLSGVSGGGVGNWFKAQSSTTNTHIEIWYGAVDTATNTSLTTPVTITAATAGGMWMTLTEWSGVSLTIDKSAAQAGTTSPASAPSITTTNASDLVILGIADNIGNTFGSPSTGTWTALTAVTTPEAQTTWYSIAAATATFNPTVTETAHTWDAAIAALKGCAATTSDASYVTGNGNNGVVNIYWASPNQVLIVRNNSNSFGTPTAGSAYQVGGGAPGGLGTIVHSGAGNVAPGTFNESIANATYYYKVWTNCDLIYSTGVVVSVAPATTSLWSYVTTAATLAPPGIDDNNVVIWGGNDNKIHGAGANTGVLGFPVFTQPTGALQARPPIIPAAYSQTGVNVAYATSQDGNVYAINTATGAQLWKKSLTAVNKLQGGAAVWLQSLQPLSICGAMTDAVFVGTRDTATTTGNIVYALNAGTSQVTTTAAGGTCVAGPVNPGDVLWTFTGTATFKLDAIVSTPYVDYTNYAGKYALWVTSNAASGLLQPSLWKFNVQNGTLFNGNAANCTTPATSCWSLGHTDSSPSASGDGTWIYVGTNCIPAGCATQAATLNAVEISSGNVKTYSPGTGGSNGTGNIRGLYPLRWSSFGTQGTIASVNKLSVAQSSASTSCVVNMASATPSAGMTAGNTNVVVVAYPIGTAKIMNVTDSRNSIYSRRRNASLGTPLTVEIWTGEIAAGTGTTVTVSFGATSTTSICSVAQYSGVGGVVNLPTAANASNAGSANASIATAAATLDTNNWAVAGFAYNNNAAFSTGTGTLRTSITFTGLGSAINDNTNGGSKVAVTNTVTHTTAAWVAAVVELRSVAVDQIVYVRDQTAHAIQFAGNVAAGSTTTFNQPWLALPGLNVSAPVDDGLGRTYIGYANGKVQQMDAWSGGNGVWGDGFLRPSVQITPLATTTLGDPSYDGVLSRLYIGGNDGRVYAVTTPW